MNEFPHPHRAIISAVTFEMTCPVCRTTVAENIAADEAVDGTFAVPVEHRFDLCSHCGEFLDLGGFVCARDAA